MHFKLPIAVLIISYVASPSMGQVDSPTSSSSVPVRKDFKNLDGKQKMDQSTSLTARPGQPVGLASRLNQLEAEFRQKIEEIKTQADISSKDQDEKIAKIMDNEQKFAHLLNQSTEAMKELKTQNRDQSKRINQLEQKLAMMQSTSPPSSAAQTRGYNIDFRKNGASNNNGRVSKTLFPPSSCQELAMLNYYLDGLYLVKNKQTKKIQTVFCKFSANEKGLASEEFIGNVDLKSKNIHFYAQRNSSFTKAWNVIPFALMRLNEGNAFNMTSGVFTALLKGIYHFQLSAVKDPSAPYLDISLQLNGRNVGRAYCQPSMPTRSFDTVSLSASLRLAANDRVNLYNQVSGALFDDDYHKTHFTGWLVEEDL